MQRLGVLLQPVRTMLETLQGMRHTVRTAFGDSVHGFESSRFPHMHGVGQGNGAAPAIWAAISSPLLAIQRSKGFGARILAPLTGEVLQIAGFSFVDDTDLCQSVPLNQDGAEAVALLQRALDSWAGSLRVTGGALVPTKSYWTLLDYKWKAGRWMVDQKACPQTILTMRNSEGRVELVERIAPSEGRRTLGVRLAADGNNQAEVEYLRNKSKEWADKIRTSKLP